MSLLRTIHRTSAVSNTTNAHPFFSFLWPPIQKKTSRRAFSKSATYSPPRLNTDIEHVQNFFVQALVQAGSCHEHRKQLSTLREVIAHAPQHHKVRRKSTWRASEKKKSAPKAELADSGPLKGVKQFARKELEALVDYYGIEFDTRPEEEEEEEAGFGPLIWNVGDAHEPWPLRDGGDAAHIKRLDELLKNDEAPHDQVFDIYSKLPSPGVVYLRVETIRSLLHHLSVLERPSPLAMQRFLSLLDDMKNAHIHVTRSEWTSAINLTGKAMGKVSVDDLQSALYIWRDMERRAGIKGGFVTLNVLFDVAVKAGKYSLAESLLKEMQTRKIKFHRHFRVSLIYYHGVMQNGNAVRRTYQDLVNAGEVVDTVVLNSVIAALIRAGEAAAAEHVFERMKRLHATKAAPAPGHTFFNRTWRHRRLLGLHFTHEARKFNRIKDQDALKELQDYAPIAPDSRTYSLLIRQQAQIAGNVDRTFELLREMRYNSVPLEGSIFIIIFHAFKDFGGVRYSSWTRDKLEKIWAQYMKALRDGLERTWISCLAVVAALRAFAKCTDADRTLRAWEEIRSLWQPNEEELEDVLRTLRRLIPHQGDGFFDTARPPL